MMSISFCVYGSHVLTGAMTSDLTYGILLGAATVMSNFIVVEIASFVRIDSVVPVLAETSTHSQNLPPTPHPPYTHTRLSSLLSL